MNKETKKAQAGEPESQEGRRRKRKGKGKKKKDKRPLHRMALEGEGIAIQVMGQFNGGFMRIMRRGIERAPSRRMLLMTVVKLGLRSGAPAKADNRCELTRGASGDSKGANVRCDGN